MFLCGQASHTLHCYYTSAQIVYMYVNKKLLIQIVFVPNPITFSYLYRHEDLFC